MKRKFFTVLFGIHQRLTQWLDRVSEPHASVQEAGQRSRAKMLAGISLAFGLIIFIILLLDSLQKMAGVVDPQEYIPFYLILIPGLGMMLVVYSLSRSRYYRIAALVFMLLATILIYVDIALVRESSLDIAYLIFGVLMGSLFFDWKATGAVLLALMLSVLGIPWLTGGALENSVFNAEIFLAVIGLMIIIIASLRERDQRRLLAQARLLVEREAALQASEEKYRLLVNEINEGIFETDLQARISFANQALAEIFGFETPEGLVGHHFVEFIRPDLVEAFKQGYSEFVAGQRQMPSFSLALARQDGSRVLVEGRPSLVLVNGAPVGTRGTLRDVTASKRAEAELQQAHARLEQRVVERTADLKDANQRLEKAARLKDEFLASMSHELRTPLTGILGLTDVLQLQTQGQLSAKQVNALEHISSSGWHLLELINDILDFSKIEAQQVNLRLDDCDVEQICQAVLKTTSKQAQHKNLAAGFSINLPRIVIQADAQRLKQMLTNLLSNAIKFTPQAGKIGIEVVGSPAEHVVQISVWDTGIGIRPEDMPRLFQTFVQLDASLARRYNGTGLGLVLVKRLAELHGGSVSVKSDFGGGSCFTLRLPWHENTGQK